MFVKLKSNIYINVLTYIKKKEQKKIHGSSKVTKTYLFDSLQRLFGNGNTEGSKLNFKPTFGVSFGLPQGGGNYPINPYGQGPYVNPYPGYGAGGNGINLGPVSVNPLVAVQVTKDEYGEKIVKPFVNLHVTPSLGLVNKVGGILANKKEALFGGHNHYGPNHHGHGSYGHYAPHYYPSGPPIYEKPHYIDKPYYPHNRPYYHSGPSYHEKPHHLSHNNHYHYHQSQNPSHYYGHHNRPSYPGGSYPGGYYREDEDYDYSDDYGDYDNYGRTARTNVTASDDSPPRGDNRGGFENQPRAEQAKGKVTFPSRRRRDVEQVVSQLREVRVEVTTVSSSWTTDN